MTLIITMSAKELDKYEVIKRLLRKEVNGTKAAHLLNLTTRHTRRLKAKVKKQGASGLIHGNRGRISNNRLPDSEHNLITKLLKAHYYDFGPTLASEKLLEHHRIKHDPKTIRQIMIKKGLWQPRIKRKGAVHRIWRERRSAYGELEQFDGSYEYWFEARGPKCCLLASIDDAEGKITKAKFDKDEGVFPVFSFWYDYLLENGCPRAIYLDKFSTYNLNHLLTKENSDVSTQFERAAQELRLNLIKANSPQAKGRVERLFHTLQDRLIKELRLNNISDIPSANQFLEKVFIPKFNERFAVVVRDTTDLHRKLNLKEQQQLASILSRQTKRTVLNDFTLSFNKQWYQLTKEQSVTVCKKDIVIIEERLAGTIHIRLRGKYLNYHLLPQRLIKQRTLKAKLPWVLAATGKAHIPAPNHPWRLATNAQILARLKQ